MIGQHGRPELKQENPLSATAEPDAIEAAEAAARSLQQFATRIEDQPKHQTASGSNSTDGNDEEAVVYSQMRMLQDPTGRLLYVGDSASLSFLQLLRMMVENVAGPSAFTTDPRRHKITEMPFSLPPTARHTHLLPDKRTAYVLVDAFFINTHGFLQIFDRQVFLNAVENCYSDPLVTEPSWLCLLNLVFAIGLMLATPRRGTADALIIDKLINQHADRAEVFYMNAKSLNDPLNGFEDADFWSVQALLLMSYYMLVKSKRNTAFALLGMAVRSAYALGLHREETLIIFNPAEQTARRNLWRSLFVMDRFLSFSLGRPVAISEDDCSGDTLRPAQPDEHDAFGFDSAFQTTANRSQTNAGALEAAVRSCSVIGRILKEVYQQRKISTRMAQEIADICKLWPKALAPQLHWRQAAAACPDQGIAILHVNLFYCHSIILLTRPFFLYIMNAETQKEFAQNGASFQPRHKYSRMEKFSEACVIASTHSIVLVQNAFEAGYLPRRNPAVIYFLFAATLVLLANEFAVLYTNTSADQCIQNAIRVMTYCSESDLQAARLYNILEAFRDVVQQQRERRRRSQQPQLQQMVGSMTNRATPQQYPSIMPQQQDAHTAYREQSFQQGLGTPMQSATTPQAATELPPPPPGTAMLSPSATAAAGTPIGTGPGASPLAHSTQPMLSPAAAAYAASASISSPTTSTGRPALSRNLSLSNLLDLSALDGVVTGSGGGGGGAPSLRSDESVGEELIDFDALWSWPTNAASGTGSPRLGGAPGDGGMLTTVQGINDSAVPLFGVYEQ
ncbi:uncharacterized protein K452DRAFT_62387 [Aplosporella prunicola CBS 121167]|uniref:Xylanolytic transcriptional activator regulatory domain-containing protein n=1 Tax=Aplosporella prunicola CBS 121167 TaxID=1176127 RepID=A0A6A6B6Q8_9PEZI|nr:uncharacterized protein K452DRAFT_62387 [Aplosporella prunicola CBS 121167]KAF2139566.1 hypothetical protein K452DRAFT_62387 [Aplosporella prunicola CBS 121167]